MINAAAFHSPAPVMHHICSVFFMASIQIYIMEEKLPEYPETGNIFFSLCWDAQCRHNAVQVESIRCFRANAIQQIFLDR